MKNKLSIIIAVIILACAAVGITFETYAVSLPEAYITDISALEQSFKVEMQEVSGITGYQVQYSTSENFDKDDTHSVITYSNFSAPENLKGDQIYYVRARAFKKTDKKIKYSLWSKTEAITVKSKIPLEKLTVSPEKAKVIIGKTLQIKVALAPDNTSFKGLKFTSSDTAVATVDDNGLVKGIKEGNVKITVRATQTDKKALIDITVKKPYVPVSSIEITNKKGLIVEAGKTLQMTAKILPADATDKRIVWKTDDEEKATIDSKGVLTAKVPTEYVGVTASTKNGKFIAKYKLKISKSSAYITKSQLDRLDLSGINNLMIVAHPDDETFWGGGHILDDTYLIVVLTNGYYKDRVSDFNKAVKYYGDDKGIILSYPDVRKYLYNSDGSYNGYETDKWSTCRLGMEADINLLLNYKKWDTVVTHNPDGEYDKYHHQQVSKMVTECLKNSKSSSAKLYYFGHYYDSGHKINAPRISDSNLRKKKEVIRIYLPIAQGAYDAFGHMLPYEDWIPAQNW